MSKFQLPYNSPSENKKILFQNARIVDPESGYDAMGNLLVIGDKIADFGDNVFADDAKIIDCQGLVLAPGLIDIQVHFRDPGQTHKEDLNSGSKSAVVGGVTTVVCQPNTVPTLDTTLTFDYLRLKAKETSYCNVRAYGCITKGMKAH